MSSKKFIAVALVGVLATGLAHARGDVQWSVSIGLPLPIFSPVPVFAHAAPVYVHPAPVYVPAPRVIHHVRPVHWDSDRDGIANRYDRVYNPRWDRDGDGIPNRHDRVYNPHWDRDGDGIPNRHDRVYNPHRDHDGQGGPWHDRREDRRDERPAPGGRR